MNTPTRPAPVKLVRGRETNGLHQWMKERVPEWVRLHDKGRGLSVYRIGELDGVSEQTVRRHLQALGQYVKSPRGWRKSEAPATKNHR